jgi:UDP-N-acetylmuramoylalanine--D-glutamate ligase
MDRRIVVLGAGESGTGAAVLAKKQGFDIFVTDSGKIKDAYKEILYNYEIDWEEGRHTERHILNADEVIKSPGISEKSDIILAIRK